MMGIVTSEQPLGNCGSFIDEVNDIIIGCG